MKLPLWVKGQSTLFRTWGNLVTRLFRVQEIASSNLAVRTNIEIPSSFGYDSSMKKRGALPKWKPADLGATKNGVLGIPITPTTVNLTLLGGGFLLGFLAWHYRDDPIGNVLLNVAGSMAGVSFVFFINEALFGGQAPA